MHLEPRRVLCCPGCGAALTTAIAAVPDERLVERHGLGPWCPQGTHALADPGPHEIMGAPSASFPIHVHPHDLLTKQLVPSGFGCCGYAPHGGPNLHCRCGAPVGMIVDECSCRVEVRLGEHFRDAPPAARVEGISARLDRLAIHPPAPARVFPQSSWEDERAATAVSPRELFVELVDDDGLRARLVADGESLALALPPSELARAIALRRLPIGNAGLALAYAHHDDANRVLSSWCITQRADEIQLVFEAGVSTRAWRVWDEWLHAAFAQAVDDCVTRT